MGLSELAECRQGGSGCVFFLEVDLCDSIDPTHHQLRSVNRDLDTGNPRVDPPARSPAFWMARAAKAALFGAFSIGSRPKAPTMVISESSWMCPPSPNFLGDHADGPRRIRQRSGGLKGYELGSQ